MPFRPGRWSRRGAGEADEDGSEERLGHGAVIMSPFAVIIEWIERVAGGGGGAAAGRGDGTRRHSLPLARAGVPDSASNRARRRARRDAAARAAARPFTAGARSHAVPRRLAIRLVIVTRYLQRNLFPALRAACAPAASAVRNVPTRRRRSCRAKIADHLLDPESWPAVDGSRSCSMREVSRQRRSRGSRQSGVT